MAGPFTLDYFVFVLIAAFGVFQMVAAYSSLRGLLFIRSRPLCFGMGLTVTCLAFLWFFLSEPRNVSDTEGGLDGNQMAGLFAVASGAALVLTLLLSSLRNRALGRAEQPPDPGMDAMKETTYLRALLATLDRIWKR